MSTKVAVVIPAYKDELTALEEISLAQCRKVLGNYPLIFLAPEGKIFPYFAPGDMIAHFPPQFFQSVQTYNRLMMTPQFYEAFGEFDYILIHQLDAFVFYDALDIFCRLGYDYIGAPWPRFTWRNPIYKKIPQVGNGGFSLRKVNSCLAILNAFAASREFSHVIEQSVEDTFFSLCGVLNPDTFRTAPVDIAEAFAMEWYPARAVKKLRNTLPFGCHNWHRFSADFYVEVFAQLGYDLRPWRSQMGNEDYDVQTRLGLENVAMSRLIRRAERGQSLTRYLPTKRFDSVFILRGPQTMRILARLILEEDFRADKIFLYDERDWRTLLRDMTCEALPHLVIAFDDDEELIAFIEQRGLVYGRHVVSFRREYLQRCEKIFRALGK